MPTSSDQNEELSAIAARYERRRAHGLGARYDPLEPATCMMLQERERALVRWLRTCGLGHPQHLHLLEVGCGDGSNLLQLLRLGFRPVHLVGNELLQDRAEAARDRLPAAVRILQGNAVDLPLPPASFDVVFQSTVFTSILDLRLQQRLADRMWSLVRPGGGVLWYDFVYDNPGNPDVRGVRVARIRQLFPQSRPTIRRVTLAPPLARLVTRVSPVLYTVCNGVPWLRTHVLCWLPKPNDTGRGEDRT
jgi:SAM-dependent methyltransferase